MKKLHDFVQEKDKIILFGIVIYSYYGIFAPEIIRIKIYGSKVQ